MLKVIIRTQTRRLIFRCILHFTEPLVRAQIITPTYHISQQHSITEPIFLYVCVVLILVRSVIVSSVLVGYFRVHLLCLGRLLLLPYFGRFLVSNNLYPPHLPIHVMSY